MYAVPLARKAKQNHADREPRQVPLRRSRSYELFWPDVDTIKIVVHGESPSRSVCRAALQSSVAQVYFRRSFTHLRRANRRRHLTGRGYDIIDRSDKFRNDSRVGGCRVSDCSRSTARFFRHVPFFSEGASALRNDAGCSPSHSARFLIATAGVTASSTQHMKPIDRQRTASAADETT